MNEFIWMYALSSLARLHDVLSGMSNFFIGISIIMASCLTFVPFVIEDMYNGDKTLALYSYVKWTKVAIVITFLSTTLTVFTPSREDLKFIIGGGIVWKLGGWTSEKIDDISKIKGAQELPENLVNSINAFLTSVASETPKKDDTTISK